MDVATIPIRGEMIRLGQLLKLAGVVGAAAEVSSCLSPRRCSSTPSRETRRGRQLHPGDVVEVAGYELHLIAAE